LLLSVPLAFLASGPAGAQPGPGVSREPSADAASGARPLRVISLFAAHTEIILRLGGRAVLVGISEQETYGGPETEGWERPPTFSVKEDVEKYLSFRPDLILVRPQHLNAASNLFETLQASGIRVWSRQITEADGLYGYWRELGALIGRSAEAERMTEEFRSALARFEGNLTMPGRPGVFLESVHREIKTFTPDSIPAWILGYAGGRNVASDAAPSRAGYIVANYGPERLLSRAPEVEVYLSQEGPMNHAPLSEITGRDIFRTLPAVRDGRVYKVPEPLISRPTPSLLEGRRYMESCIRDGKPPEGLN
jgi:iron complex transport system substrate-binding protein